MSEHQQPAIWVLTGVGAVVGYGIGGEYGYAFLGALGGFFVAAILTGTNE